MPKKNQATVDAPESEAVATEETPQDAAGEEFQFVEDPSYDIQYKGDCAYEVAVTIPTSNERKQADTLFEELKGEAEVPGFRKGRAPRKLLERRFGKVIRNDVESRLISAAFRKLVTDEKLKPIRVPDVDGLDDKEERPEDAPLTFTLKFEVLPRVELGKYRGLDVERPVVTVEDGDIDESIKELRMRHAVYESIKGAAKDGDQVVIDFTGTVDGEPFQGGSANGYPYILGSKHFFPEFETALAGSKKGNERTCEVTLPENNPNEALRGKTATFAITIKDVKRRKPPELNDDFAKLVGHDSVDVLRSTIREQLQNNSRQTSQHLAEAHALRAVIDGSKFEIPKSLIDNVAEDHFRHELRHLMSRRVPVSQIEQHEAEMRDAAQKTALREIQELTVLNEIGEAEGIQVTEEDFEHEITSIAERTGTQTDVVSQYFQEEEGRRNSYEDRIYRAKALKVVMDSATITDKEVPKDAASDTENEDA